MPAYAADVATTTIAVFNAANLEEAKNLVFNREGGLAEDWKILEHDGLPVWDGKERLTVREATPIEYNRWQVSRDNARQSGENVDEEGIVHVLYLVSLEDPTDEDNES